MRRTLRSIFIFLIAFSTLCTADAAVTASKEKLIREVLVLTHAQTAPDGRARVQVIPEADPDDTTALRQFVTAVLAGRGSRS